MSKRLRGFLVATLGLAALIVLVLVLVAVFGTQGGGPVAQQPSVASVTLMAYPPSPPIPMPTQLPTLFPTATPEVPPQTAPAAFTPTPSRQAGGAGYLNQPKVTDLQWLVPYYAAVFLAEVVQVQPTRWTNPENKRPENWGDPAKGWQPGQGGSPFTPVDLKVVEWLKLPQLTNEQEAWGICERDEAARMRASPPSAVTLHSLYFGRIVGKENILGGQGWPELREGDQAIFVCGGPCKQISGDLQMITFGCMHAFPVTSSGMVTDLYGNALPLEKVRSLIQKALQGEISP